MDTPAVRTPDAPGPNPLVEEVLRLEFWDKSFYDAMSTLAALPEVRASQSSASQAFLQPTPRQREMQTRRAVLSSMPESELLQLRADLLTKQKAAQLAAEKERQRMRDAAAAEKERKQFYNQPDAQANFDYWLKFDFWSFDQAIALILGKNPNVVTWEKVSQAIDPPRLLLAAKPTPSTFLKAYQNLRTLAGASDVMTAGARLRPADVASWARNRLGLSLPKPLADLLAPPAPNQAPPSPEGEASVPSEADQGQSEPESQAESTPVLVKRAALKALSDSWPSVESDLRHSDRNGLAAAAKAPEHGMWREQDAIEWARRNGRLKAPRTISGIHDLPRRIFKA
jgi:hypothetical protein